MPSLNTTISSIGLALVLTGCGLPGNQRYVEPTSGERARIRLTTDSTIRIFPNARCADWKTPGVGTGPIAKKFLPIDYSNNGKTLGMPGKTPEGLTSSELYLKANEHVLIFYVSDVPFRMSSTGPGIVLRSCGGVFAFKPQANVDYAGMFAYAGGNQCIREVVTLDQPVQSIPNDFDPEFCPK